MALHVDYAAQRAFSRIIAGLRSARLDAELSQNALATGLPVRGRAVSEWETGAIEPTLGHLIQWSWELGRRLVIVGRDGELRYGPVRQRPGELWEAFERRRLAVPLRNRRLALGMAQGELGELVGVSRDSIQRWELVRVPPRPIAHVVWAQKLGYSLDTRPVADGGPRLRRVGSAGLALPGLSGQIGQQGQPGLTGQAERSASGPGSPAGELRAAADGRRG
ncbi:transcriptional regulator, XRE family [Catenulispora acidiphila DSM 44928]|uniref:Transcriptional regulator, XRE family n=1 Tax=Catenulispora acidiphila (strain DSM 44928 / JCM 14897 / NBRC 102108 / NRRL B-24433 / ID139908) TaxID=479433 RepID=C7QFN1_CATAD|nr:helix-turn-helix transcriptional regulator [Catenulispora acidiphila]ACU68970.1 transcriptional regulator, XRE family [Catenulispora acidiphila DSM 44928]